MYRLWLMKCDSCDQSLIWSKRSLSSKWKIYLQFYFQYQELQFKASGKHILWGLDTFFFYSFPKDHSRVLYLHTQGHDGPVLFYTEICIYTHTQSGKIFKKKRGKNVEFWSGHNTILYLHFDTDDKSFALCGIDQDAHV